MEVKLGLYILYSHGRSLIVLLHFSFRSMEAALVLYTVAGGASLALNLRVAFLLLRTGCQPITSREWVIMSMVVADLMRTAVGYPIEVYNLFSERLGDKGCDGVGFLLTFTSLVSICHLAGVSVERAVLLTNAMKGELRHTDNKDSWHSLYVIVPSWLCGLLWAIAPLLGWSSYLLSEESGICSINLEDPTDNNMSYLYSLLLGCFIVPLTMMVVSFFIGRRGFLALGEVIVRQKAHTQLSPSSLKTHNLTSSVGKITESVDVNLSTGDKSDAVNNGPDPDVLRWNKLQKKYAVESFTMVVSFVVMWTPYALCVFVQGTMGEVPVTLMRISAYLGKFSTVSNPSIHLIFRYKKMLGRSMRGAKSRAHGVPVEGQLVKGTKVSVPLATRTSHQQLPHHHCRPEPISESTDLSWGDTLGTALKH